MHLHELSQQLLDLFLQGGGGRSVGIAGILAIVGGFFLAIILFFTGVIGKISEKVGQRLERSEHSVTRSIGTWLVDRDPVDVRNASSPTPVNQHAGTAPLQADIAASTYIVREQDDLTEMYSRDLLLSIANGQLQSEDLDLQLEEGRRAISAAFKYISDQEETKEYREAIKVLPWLEEFAEAQIDLRVSYDELLASQSENRDEKGS